MLSTIELPEGRAVAARETLRAAEALADELLKTPPAVAMGKKGGLKTAERGPEYFKRIAAMRKTKGGDRPRRAGRAAAVSEPMNLHGE
jgi:hypothetical protein